MVTAMSKFRRNSIIVLIAELILIAVFNIVLFTNKVDNNNRQYRVDINRIETAMNAGETVGLLTK